MDARAASQFDRGATTRGLGPALVGLLAVVSLLNPACNATEAGRSTPSPGQGGVPAGRLAASPNVSGDPTEGRRLFTDTGCGGCHTTLDVPGATGVAGPNLTNVVLRPTLAGESISMTPASLADFLRAPGEVKPGTAMPSVGLTAEEARHITAYLYSQPYNPIR